MTDGRAADAWEDLTSHARDVAGASSRDAFFLGFQAGWAAEANRPYFCAFCSFECKAENNEETLAAIQGHVKNCEFHPLAIELRELRARL